MKFGLGLRRRTRHVRALLQAFIVRMLPDPTIEVTAGMIEDQGSWFVSREEARALASAWSEQALIHDGNRSARHEFDFLGTGAHTWGPTLPWHADVCSKRVWPQRYHKYLLADLTGVGGSDVKIPWELSRFQHLVPLAKAYLAGGDPVYARVAAADICDWIVKNPFRYGVNWTCAMEVAIRSCNWLWAWWAFAGASSWSQDFQVSVVQSLWQHAWYIEHNLEDRGGIRTNHYLADIVGLLFVSLVFPALPRASERRSFAARELAKCMHEMVYSDGVCFENSTSYQRLVMELFTASSVLCLRNGVSLPGQFWERLERMFEFVGACTRPDGRMPMVGDADDGRFFALDGYSSWDPWDLRYLLSAGAVLFRRGDFKRAAGRRYTSVDLLFGVEGVALWEAL